MNAQRGSGKVKGGMEVTKKTNEVNSLYIRISYQFRINTQTQRRSATLSVHSFVGYFDVFPQQVYHAGGGGGISRENCHFTGKVCSRNFGKNRLNG